MSIEDENKAVVRCYVGARDSASQARRLGIPLS